MKVVDVTGDGGGRRRRARSLGVKSNLAGGATVIIQYCTAQPFTTIKIRIIKDAQKKRINQISLCCCFSHPLDPPAFRIRCEVQPLINRMKISS